MGASMLCEVKPVRIEPAFDSQSREGQASRLAHPSDAATEADIMRAWKGDHRHHFLHGPLDMLRKTAYGIGSVSHFEILYVSHRFN